MYTRRELAAVGALALAGAAGCLDSFETSSDDDSGTDDGSAGSEGEGSESTDDGDPADSALEPRDPDAPLVTTSADADSEDADGAESEDDTADTESDGEDAESDGETGGRAVLATYGDVVDLEEHEAPHSDDRYELRLHLEESAADDFVDDLEAVGALDEPTEQQLSIHADGEVFDSYSLGPNLADAMAAGEWNGTLAVDAADESRLETLREAFGTA